MAKGKRRIDAFSSDELRELTYIRKLLMMQLIRDGVESKEIASVLGIDASTVTRAVPSRKIRKKGGKE